MMARRHGTTLVTRIVLIALGNVDMMGAGNRIEQFQNETVDSEVVGALQRCTLNNQASRLMRIARSKRRDCIGSLPKTLIGVKVDGCPLARCPHHPLIDRLRNALVRHS